jgi:hypothetical protein
MKLPVYSFIACIVLVIVYSIAAFYGKSFSRETYAREYHNEFHVEQGASRDGKVFITATEHPINVSPVTRVMNHNRTLRASLTTSSPATPSQIIIERAGVLQSYELHGPFFITSANANLHWISPTTISFAGANAYGILSEYIVDVRTVSYTEHAVINVISSSTIQKQSLIVD